MKRLFRYIISLVVAVVAVGCVSENLPSKEESSKVYEGDMAPKFSTTLLDGSRVSLDDYRGAPLLLIMFDCGCPDCKNLLDDLHSAISEGEKVPQILAIGRDSDSALIEQYRADNGYTIPMAPDPDRAVYGLYASTYVPRAYLLDDSGRIVMMTIEYDDWYMPELLRRARAMM
ncbi:MAG: TlpA family protein disulfide reductase [Alistipes sp.]|nr:TlpA family protein disulfide reductase [Alistipes sp.]MBR3892660.1 TlpA family protein disulfide reductase [Alistipes sp.]